MSGRPREIAMKRRIEIKNLIEEIGLWNVTRQPLADKYEVSRQMIDKDIHAIMKGMPAEDLKEIQFNLKNAYKKAMREMQKILATSSIPLEKARAAQVIGKLGQQYTEMLENYGLKEKVADKLEHSGKITWEQIWKELEQN